ncbi:hypothetical protein GTN30_00340 [Macrococcoides canis]|uniref:Uncharacterized protein n=1 Tax=Macrococcoides canis TaxID=1855823 RepID=A0AAE6X0F5_9STAP|nr:hypothetical protein GTN30_00340 [Macrococcus canis]
MTIKSIKALHKKLFGRIHIFAGEFRDVSLMKENTRFCEPQYINMSFQELFDNLIQKMNGQI